MSDPLLVPHQQQPPPPPPENHHPTRRVHRPQQQQERTNRNRNNNNNQQHQQYQQYYNPTLHDLSTRPSSASTSTTIEWFRHAPVTKTILLFTIVYNGIVLFASSSSLSSSYHSSTTTNSRSNSYSNFLSQIIFTSSSSSSYHHHYNPNETMVVMMMGIAVQTYMNRILERQMSSYQFLRFVIFCTTTATAILRAIIILLIPMERLFEPTQPPTSMTVMLLTGPYSILGATILYYHWYIPRIYPRFITILSTVHCSDKSLFYIYLWYFIRCSAIGTTSSVNNELLYSTTGTTTTTTLLSNFIIAYRGLWSIVVPMSIGMLSAVLYHYISNHPLLIQYDRIVHVRFIHPIVQRLTTFTTTAATNTNHRRNNINNNHRATAQQQQQPPPPNHLRQRYNAATGTAATLAAISDTATATDRTRTDFEQSMMNAATNSTTTNMSLLLPPDQVDTDAVEQLCAMGFPHAQVIYALRQSQNHVEHAAHRLLSVSSSSDENNNNNDNNNERTQ